MTEKSLPPTDKAETTLEAQLQAMGLNAPRVTPDMIDSMIEGVEYHYLSDTHLVCKITMLGGRFHVIGESSTVSKENFNKAKGEEISYRNAREKVWPVAGAILANDLHNFRMPLTEDQLKLPDYAQRMIQEIQQVHGRVEILQPLLANEARMTELGLDATEIADLKEQVEHMVKYRAVLQRRMSRIPGL